MKGRSGIGGYANTFINVDLIEQERNIVRLKTLLRGWGEGAPPFFVRYHMLGRIVEADCFFYVFMPISAMLLLAWRLDERRI